MLLWDLFYCNSVVAVTSTTLVRTQIKTAFASAYFCDSFAVRVPQCKEALPALYLFMKVHEVTHAQRELSSDKLLFFFVC